MLIMMSELEANKCVDRPYKSIRPRTKIKAPLLLSYLACKSYTDQYENNNNCSA